MPECHDSEGASTPEELETSFEDALLLRDPTALSRLFDGGSTLVAREGRVARGGAEIARLALMTWPDDASYVANPRSVIQTHDIALIIADRVINVAFRGHDGGWRYAIVFVVGQVPMKGVSNGNARSSTRAKPRRQG